MEKVERRPTSLFEQKVMEQLEERNNSQESTAVPTKQPSNEQLLEGSSVTQIGSSFGSAPSPAAPKSSRKVTEGRRPSKVVSPPSGPIEMKREDDPVGMRLFGYKTVKRGWLDRYCLPTPPSQLTLLYTTPHLTTSKTTSLHADYSSMLLYTTPNYTTLHYTTLHYTTLHYTTLHYTTLHYTTLHQHIT